MDIINRTNSVPQTHQNRLISDIHSSLTLNFSSHLFFIVVVVFFFLAVKSLRGF